MSRASWTLGLLLVALTAHAAAPAKKKPAPPPPPPADAPMATPRPPPAEAPTPPPSLPRPSLLPAGMKAAASGDTTQCAACHGVSGWLDVKFDHSKTGFPLTGAHSTVGCKDCHPKNFETSVPLTCAGCHRDVHAGDLGQRCETCHDTERWATQFGAEAHHRTGFPLVGGHAFIPCTECHGETRDRKFGRPVVSCLACHETDRLRTTGTAIDHFALGFPDDCRGCHGAWAFKPASFPEHDRCFFISGGPHAAVSCQGCHATLTVSNVSGTCNTGTAQCISCHEHTCMGPGGPTETDKQHAAVSGYQCKDRKCYECHQFGRGGP